MGAPLGDGKHCPCCQGPRKPRPTRPTESAPCTVCLPPGMQSHSWRAFSAAHLRPIVTLHFANREPTGHSTMWKRDFYTSNLWHKWVPISKGLMRPVGREAGAPDPPQPAEADDAPQDTCRKDGLKTRVKMETCPNPGGSLGLPSGNTFGGRTHRFTEFSNRLTRSYLGKTLCETTCSD